MPHAVEEFVDLTLRVSVLCFLLQKLRALVQQIVEELMSVLHQR